MKIVYQCEQPDQIEMTLTMTASLKEWKELKEQLNSAYPSWKLSNAIIDAVIHATQSYEKKIATQ